MATSRTTRTPLQKFRNMLKEDDNWQKFRRQLKTAWKPEYDGYTDQIMDLHKRRSIRTMGVNSTLPTGKKVAHAAMQDQATRSNCVEIVMNLTRDRNWIYQIRDATRNYLMAQYHDFFIDEGLKTIADRGALVDIIFTLADERLNVMDTIIELADKVIEDCDKGSYTLKHVVDALTVATKRELVH